MMSDDAQRKPTPKEELSTSSAKFELRRLLRELLEEHRTDSSEDQEKNRAPTPKRKEISESAVLEELRRLVRKILEENPGVRSEDRLKQWLEDSTGRALERALLEELHGVVNSDPASGAALDRAMIASAPASPMARDYLGPTLRGGPVGIRIRPEIMGYQRGSLSYPAESVSDPAMAGVRSPMVMDYLGSRAGSLNYNYSGRRAPTRWRWSVLRSALVIVFLGLTLAARYFGVVTWSWWIVALVGLASVALVAVVLGRAFRR